MTVTALSDVSTDIAAHQRLMRFALRPQLYFDACAEVSTVDTTSAGVSCTFYFSSELAAATSPLTETSDVTPVAMGDSVLTVTPLEYGNAVKTSAKLRATSFIPVNPTMVNVLGYNAGISVDQLASNALVLGTNIAWSTGTGFATSGSGAENDQLATTDILNGNMVRFATAKLRGGSAMPFSDGLYRGFIHPDVAYDFKGTTGGTNWSDPHVYSSPEGIWNGTIGAFQGVRWIESPRAPLAADAGDGANSTGTIDAYTSIVMGREALAKGHAMGQMVEYAEQPIFVDSPVIDNLRRFQGAGWKHFVAYSVFRQAALYQLRSASSIGANS